MPRTLAPKSVLLAFRSFIPALVALTPAFAQPPAHPPHFSPPRLIESPYGLTTFGTDINDRNVVVGVFGVAQTDRAFAWSRSMGFVELPPTTDQTFSSANAINECGEIAGEANLAANASGHAVVWHAFEEVEDLGTLGGAGSGAFAINDRGNVAGTAQTTVIGESRPFLWTREQGMRDLGSLGGRTGIARAMNNHDEVVGNSDNASDDQHAQHAFYWSARTGMIDLGTGGFDTSSASGINDDGVVVGVVSSNLGETARAFKWTLRGGMVLLPDLGNQFGFAQGINDRGQIVGEAIDDAGARRATLWLRGKRAYNIDPSTGISSGARTINSRGVVLGNAAFSNPNDVRAVLWRLEGADSADRQVEWASEIDDPAELPHRTVDVGSPHP